MLTEMAPAVIESPADEYERRVEERQEATKQAIRRCLKLWFGAHIAVAVLLVVLLGYVLLFIAFRPPAPGVDIGFWTIVTLAGLCGLCAIVGAAESAFRGLRHWRDLTWLRRAAALTPWLVTSGEALWLFMGIL